MGHRFMQQSMKEAVETKGLLSAAINKVGNVVHSAVMGMQGAVEIPNADAYVQALADNFVMVDQDARRELIRQQVTELAAAEGGIAEIDEDLLEEVNYLVEYYALVSAMLNSSSMKTVNSNWKTVWKN